MVARCPGMEPSPRSGARRLRGLCLAVALLCALTAATGAIARAGTGHHHHHGVIAAAPAGLDTGAAHAKRSALEATVADRPDPHSAPLVARGAGRSATTPAGTPATPARTRGPPVPA